MPTPTLDFNISSSSIILDFWVSTSQGVAMQEVRCRAPYLGTIRTAFGNTDCRPSPHDVWGMGQWAIVELSPPASHPERGEFGAERHLPAGE